MFGLVKTQWAEFISKNVNLKKYTVEASVGQGNISASPWLTIMDKTITESATEGFYVVYLFSRSAKKQGDKYHIYLVNNVFNKDTKIFERIQNPAQQVAKKKILLTVAIWNLKLN